MMRDTNPGQIMDSTEYSAAIEEFRQQKNAYFATSSDSPIPQSKRQGGFSSLQYFPPDLAYRVAAEVVPFAKQELVELATSTGDLRPQVRYAELRFRLGGQELRLVGFS